MITGKKTASGFAALEKRLSKKQKPMKPVMRKLPKTSGGMADQMGNKVSM